MFLFVGAKVFYVYKNRYVTLSLFALISSGGSTLMLDNQLALANMGCNDYL